MDINMLKKFISGASLQKVDRYDIGSTHYMHVNLQSTLEHLKLIETEIDKEDLASKVFIKDRYDNCFIKTLKL